MRWGQPGASTASELVAEPQVQLDGLTDGARYDVEVRAVDSFGQRSAPVRVSAQPGAAAPDPTTYSFVDRFDGPSVPDARNWNFASPGFCAKATRGDPPDDKRLVISANCGSASVALRARAPFKLTNGKVRGSVVVDTDAPGEAGELLIDLVPGPADLIDGSPSGPPKPGKPGVAQQDPSLPPGTVRVRIAAQPADADDPKATETVQVITAPNVHRTAVAVAVQPVPEPRIAENVRWQVVVHSDAVVVLRNGIPVGGGAVTVPWQQTTALIGFIGPSGGFRAGVAMIGFTGAPTAPPAVMAAPEVQTSRTVEQTGMVLAPVISGQLLTGAQAAQLRLSLLPQSTQTLKSLDGTLTVDVGGKRVLATPAVRGQPLARGVRYPVVALLPKEALLLGGDRNALTVTVSSNVQQKGNATLVEFGDVELYPTPGTTPPPVPASKETPLPRPHPAVARAQAQMLGATGEPMDEGATVAPGRVVLDVHLDGPAAQRIAGSSPASAGSRSGWTAASSPRSRPLWTVRGRAGGGGCR